MTWLRKLDLLPFVAFASCAGPGDNTTPPVLDAGLPDTGIPETGAPTDAGPDGDGAADPEPARCSGELCIVDIPNAGAFGFTQWIFAGVQIDPVIGTWAIANGIEGLDESTAQILRFDGTGWKPMHAPTLGSGADKRNIRLRSLASNGAGKLLAVGATIDDKTTVLVRGDGTTFTVERFDGPLNAAWFAGPEEAWVVGTGGAVFRSSADGGWTSESADAGDFFTVWGTGPNDVYVAGKRMDEPDCKECEPGPEPLIRGPWVGHRTADDAGAKWKYQVVNDLGFMIEPTIQAGVAVPEGPRYLATNDHLVRAAIDAGQEVWVKDSFTPPIVIRSFWARAKNDIWAVGDIGRVYRFDGTTWKDARLAFNGAPLIANLNGISGTAAGEVIIVGDGISLRRKAR